MTSNEPLTCVDIDLSCLTTVLLKCCICMGIGAGGMRGICFPLLKSRGKTMILPPTHLLSSNFQLQLDIFVSYNYLSSIYRTVSVSPFVFACHIKKFATHIQNQFYTYDVAILQWYRTPNDVNCIW